ncbi:MAG: SCP2 sterol-binding domain-containing protein [Marmoricola sp.]
MAFKDADEVRHYIGSVFSNAFADAEIGPKLRSTGIVLGFAFTDPDAKLVIDTIGGTVGDGTGQPTPTAVMSMTSDLGSAYWQGKVNLPLAMARGKIKVEGNVASLLKLAPLGKKLFPSYVDTLNAEGRADLLA